MGNEGFVLTCNQRDQLKGIELRYWIVTDSGAKCIVIPEQEAVFFILSSDLEKVEQLLKNVQKWRIAPLNLLDLNHSPVFGIYFSSLNEMRRAITILQGALIPLMEEDIRIADRYLMERFIKGGVESIYHEGKVKLKASNVAPSFKVLSLDIETDMHLGNILCIGVQTSENLKYVLMLGEGSDTDIVKYCGSEKELLRQFVLLIKLCDPDIIIGWNVIGFDFWVIQQRAEKFNVKLTIGREGKVCRIHKSSRGKTYLRIEGRVVLDGIDVLKGATYQFDSYSLENVSRQLLNKGKAVENVAHRADEIIEMYQQDKAALAKYNLMDCELVLDIFSHAQLIDYLVQRMQLTGLVLDKVGGWSSAFDNLYLPLLHRKGFVAPQYASGVANMSSPGGYVMNSIPGLYRHVLVLDFKSLYPSIIRTFKIDPLGLALSKMLQDEAQLVPGFNGAVFTKEENILPGIISELGDARDQAKKIQNNAMSQAIKILMSSMYGVLGSNACRFFDHRLSGSITLRGHEILTTTAKRITEQFGYQVIYGDTDSVFVWLGDECGDQEAHDIGHFLAENLTRWWEERLSSLFKIDSFLELEYETHYTKFLMPTMRDSDQGTKKRYAGLQHFSNGDTKMVFKGMENVRSDWTELAKRVQEYVFNCVFHEEPFEQYLLDIVRQVRLGLLDHELVYHKKLRQPVQDYTKNRPPHAQAALKLEKYYQSMDLRQTLHRGQVIQYYITVNGAEPIENLSSALDYDHYIDRQLKPALDALLAVKGTSFEQIVGLQINLF